MKIKNLLLVIVAALLLSFSVAWITHAQRAQPTPRAQWEYRRETLAYRTGEPAPDVNNRIEGLGAEGWEFVQFVPENNSTLWGVYIFKRQK